jgi:hypothetical protein
MRRTKSGLFLPVSGMSRSVQFGEWTIFGEDGMVSWNNESTGKFFQVEPKRSIAIANTLYRDLLGKGVEGSIAHNRQQFEDWQQALQKVHEIAREQLEKFQDSVNKILNS